MILGIETSCDEIAASLVDSSFAVHKNIIFSSCELAKTTGGVVPEIAARDAAEKISQVLAKATKDMDWTEISAIAVTNGPGLSGPLLTGIEAAKTLAFLKNKPLIPVFHIFGHMSANFLERDNAKKIPQNKTKDEVIFPALVLTVSGGHNDLYLWKAPLEYEKMGGTIDDAAGECFDKCARMLGLPYPGGPNLSKCAENGNQKKYDFPRPMCNKKDNFDFSFSGLKTALFYKEKEVRGKNPEISPTEQADLAASIQWAIVDTFLKKLFRAVDKYGAKQVHLTGGVSANTLLKERFLKECKKREISGIFPRKNVYSTDNGAMIAAAGQLHWQHNPLYQKYKTLKKGEEISGKLQEEMRIENRSIQMDLRKNF